MSGMKRGRLGSRAGIMDKGQKTDEDKAPPGLKNSLDKFRKIVTLQSKAQTVKALVQIFPLALGKKTEVEEEPEQPERFPGKIWDDRIAFLAFKNKRSSVISREIGLPSTPKHVRLSVPSRNSRFLRVIVKKKMDSGKEVRRVLVIKRAGENDIGHMSEYGGPRCNRQGQIIPHSILGKVEEFLTQARERGEFQEILATATTTPPDTAQSDVVATVQRSAMFKDNPLLNEHNALRRWEEEMELRIEEQARLAELLGRPMKELLMSRTDDFVKVQEGRTLFRRITEKNNPAVCFWKLEPRQGFDQLCSSLTRSEKGLPPTPVLSGDADSVFRQKGKTRGAAASDWFKSPYLKQRDREVLGGVIHICNNVLFDKLEITGTPVYPGRQSSVTSLYGDVSCDSAGDSTGSCDSEPMETTISGPSLYIDGTTCGWEGNGFHDNHVSTTTDHVAVATHVLIVAPIGKVVKGYVTLYNNGSTMLRYSWKKVPDVRPLPVHRPRSKVFYFLGDEGIILPGDTIHVPMLFRSRVPGYYTESWSLLTVPVLLGGAQIWFIFKGSARGEPDYSKECASIEEMLARRETDVMCSRLASKIVDSAILKAYVKTTRLRDDPIFLSEAEAFQEVNPPLFYHVYTVKKLHSMFESVSLELQKPGTSKSRGTTPGDQAAVSLAELRKSILQLPDDDAGDDEGSHCHISHKEDLLNQLWTNAAILSFPPLSYVECKSHFQYCVAYGMVLQTVDNMVDFAHLTAGRLGLVKRKERNTNDTQTNKKSASLRPKVKGGRLDVDFPVARRNSAVRSRTFVPVVDTSGFSPVIKCRTASKRNTATLGRSLELYDEKVYTHVYSMLEQVLDGMTALFSTPAPNQGR